MRDGLIVDVGTTHVKLFRTSLGKAGLTPVLVRRNDDLLDNRGVISLSRVDEFTREFQDLVRSEITCQTHGIWITGQMHGLVVCDRDLRCSSDMYSWIFGDRVPVSSFDRTNTGCFERPHYTANLIANLRSGGEYANNLIYLTPLDYLVSSLVGRPAAVHSSMASSMGLFDVVHQTWAAATMRSLGLQCENLPRVSGAVTKVGTLGGVAVYCAIGDHASACYLAVSRESCPISLNIGTGAQVASVLNQCIVSSEYETRPALGGGHLGVVPGLMGGRIFDARFEELGYAATEKKLAYDVLTGGLTELPTDNRTERVIDECAALSRACARNFAQAIQQFDAKHDKSIYVTGTLACPGGMLWDAMKSEIGDRLVHLEDRNASAVGLQMFVNDQTQQTSH